MELAFRIALITGGSLGVLMTISLAWNRKDRLAALSGACLLCVSGGLFIGPGQVVSWQEVLHIILICTGAPVVYYLFHYLEQEGATLKVHEKLVLGLFVAGIGALLLNTGAGGPRWISRASCTVLGLGALAALAGAFRAVWSLPYSDLVSSKRRYGLFAVFTVAISGEAAASTGAVFSQPQLSQLGGFLLSIAMILLYAARETFPDLGAYLEFAAAKGRPTGERLSYDAPRLRSQVRFLFEQERVFLREDLRLSTLAAELDEAIHIVSHFLNSEMKVTFTGIVSQYRVVEAMKLLRAEPDVSIADIALRSGFNSLSAFNRSFLKTAGRTAREFRMDADAEPPALRFFD